MRDNFIITVTNNIEGCPIEKYLESICANVVIGTNIFSDIAASFSDFFGGHSGSYKSKLELIYNEASKELKKKAIKLGANAIVGFSVDFDVYSLENYSNARKKDGFLQGAKSNGLAVEVCRCDLSFDAAKEAVLAAYQKGIPFDAVVTADDVLAVGAMKAAHALKLRVPEDFAVVGYNNMLLTESSTPRITSVDCNPEELCKTAVQLLMDSMENGHAPQTKWVGCRLVEKETI